VTQQIYPGAWSAALDALRLDPTQTEAPRAEPGVWRQIHAKFTRRGFVRGLLGCTAPQGAAVLWIEIIPPGRDAAAFGAEVCAWAMAHGAASAAVVAAGPPAELRLEWASGEDGRAMDALTMLLKIGDYFQALEQNAAARSPLESQHAATPSAAAPASVFEPIGAMAPAAPVVAPATPTAFEVIGGPTGVQDSGPLRITAREITARGARVSARLTCSRTVSDGEQARLRDGLMRALRLRFDVEPRSVEATGDQVQVELDALGDGATGDLVSRLGAYLARLIELNALGLTLEEALGSAGVSAAQRPAASVVAPRLAPATPAAPAAPAARGGEEVVVLDLGGSGSAGASSSFRGEHAPTMQGREGALRPKDFMDPRLKRADATTPLVDVVLRHPGYAERATAQAIGILLSVEHHRAQSLVESAPCVIAWGVGREQAQTLKTVVEGAGGKVLLVEPGTFGQR
jgi:hypothetical protein